MLVYKKNKKIKIEKQKSHVENIVSVEVFIESKINILKKIFLKKYIYSPVISSFLCNIFKK